MDCKKWFEPEFHQAIVCTECCRIPDELVCHDNLHLGEGMIECDLARKSHFPDMPHLWEGMIGDKKVYIEWR